MRNYLKLWIGCFFSFCLFLDSAYSKSEIVDLGTSSSLTDSLELIDFFNALDGTNWNNSWDFTSPISTWYGVELNANGCVLELNLIDNNLTGPLTDLNLPYLETMLLSNNNISGPIPDFSNIGNLKRMNLDENNFDGTIPNFTNLALLEILHLSNCGLTGVIPDFSGLENLWQLIASGNNLEGPIPNFSNLVSLQYLQLSNNSLSGEIPNFSNIPELSELLLHDNELSGNIPDFNSLELLSTLGLSRNQLSGTIPDFSGVPELSVLNLAENVLVGGVPDFSNLSNLFSLDLSYNQLSGTIPDFSDLSNLSNLYLTGNNLFEILPDFSNLPSLFVLFIDDNDFDTLPVFTNLSAEIYPANNSLTFDDLLPSILLNDVSTYSPQDSIYEQQTIIINEGADLEIDLNIDDLIATNTYQWYKNGSLYNPPSSQNKLNFNNIQLQDAGTYTCNVRNNGAFLLTLISRPVTIIVEENPLKLLVNFIDINPCPNEEGGSIDIEACGGVPPYNFFWSNNEITEDLEGISNGQYIVTITDANNEMLIDTFLLFLNTSFPSADAGEDDFICGEDLVLLSSTNAANLNGEWSAISSSVVIESPNENYTSAYGLFPGNNLFVWTLNTDECLNYDRDTVLINYLPSPITVDDAYEVNLDSLNFVFDVLANDSYSFSKNKWTVECLDFVSQDLDCSSNGLFTYQINGNEEDYLFQYELCSSICLDLCDTASVVLSFIKEEKIPNAITVNGDGVNDTFQFPEHIFNSQENEGIIIFNRWGNIVYRANPYLNNWDGTSSQGNDLPSGTYYYRFILDVVNEKIYFGDITILR